MVFAGVCVFVCSNGACGNRLVTKFMFAGNGVRLH